MSNILIIKHGSLGDLIQANGAIKDIKEYYENRKVFLLTSSPYSVFMSECPYIDGVIIDKRLPRWNLLFLYNLKKLLSKYDFSKVFDLQNSQRTNFYRNFITKITNYEKICSIPNSMTVLPDFFPIIFDLLLKRQIGTLNLTNPGLISHNEILEMYKEIVDNDFTWKNFTIEEQDKILDGKRSNNFLDTNKLKELYPEIKNIKDSVRLILQKYRKD